MSFEAIAKKDNQLNDRSRSRSLRYVSLLHKKLLVCRQAGGRDDTLG